MQSSQCRSVLPCVHELRAQVAREIVKELQIAVDCTKPVRYFVHLKPLLQCWTSLYLLIHKLNAEDTGGLGTPLAEGSLGALLDQTCLDGPVGVVGIQGSNGQHCLLG